MYDGIDTLYIRTTSEQHYIKPTEMYSWVSPLNFKTNDICKLAHYKHVEPCRHVLDEISLYLNHMLMIDQSGQLTGNWLAKFVVEQLYVCECGM